jgi:outer membrane protein OmpA-like peptidoglycan-associated protein
MKIFRTFLILICAISYSSLHAQDEKPECGSSENKDAVKNYEKGIDRKKNDKKERMAYLSKALELDPEYPAANFAIAQEIIVTQKLNEASYKPAAPFFEKVVELCPKFHSDPYYYLGFIAYEGEKYEDAAKYLNQFVKFKDDDEKKFSKDYDFFLDNAKGMLKYVKFQEEVMKHPVPFDPHLVRNIDTDKDEYLPIISPDNELCLFTRRQTQNSKNQVWTSDKLVEIFSFAERKNGEFDKGQPMPSPPFNKNNNEGGATLSIDNKHLFYTICKDEGGLQLNCDIYYSDFVDGQWTEVKPLGAKVNDPVFWDSQPCIAADGKTLYFSSDRKGGLGGIDIYITQRDEVTREWSTPKNLGPLINTSRNDKSPFMHSDSQTLYFSSEGHETVGGFDIFYCRKNEKGEWMEPKNIGYPINTEADDLGFFVSTDGKLGYFASNNPGKTKGLTAGGWDIYSFDLYQDARPDKVAFIKGQVKDEVSQDVKGTKVEIKDVKTKQKIDAVVDSLTGEYAAMINLKKHKEVIVNVKKEGYAFNSQIITLKDTTVLKPQKVDFGLKTIVKGDAYNLNNIYYTTNSAELEEKSKIVVEEFAEFLKENPDIKIEIQGHTDNVGKPADNLALSTNRAYTVKEALEEKGIAGSRITARGFGSIKPAAPNDTEANRLRNRRTEFVITDR